MEDDSFGVPELGLAGLTVHPEWTIPAEIWGVVDLWIECRGDALVLPLPGEGGRIVPIPAGRMTGRFAFAGGAADQPNWLVDAFAICERVWTVLERGDA